ncbi:MAG: indolepyruvate oxidoreductase subunit beta [Oscillospiraceae bacterium]
MTNDTKNVMIVGVGGQGTLLASRLLGEVLTRRGYDVKVSEVHGMSQRGGSVVTYVRYGSRVSSPVIELGEADAILSFELLEAARYLPYLKREGMLIINDNHIDPMPVITGAATYPEDLVEALEANPVRVELCDALTIAETAGSAKAVNVVLMARLARVLDFPREEWESAIADVVPPRFRELNLEAFRLSYDGPEE